MTWGRLTLASLALLWACAAPADGPNQPDRAVGATTTPAERPGPSPPSRATSATAADSSEPAPSGPSPEPATDFPLFARYPALASKVARAPLGRWPTPVTALPGLATEFGAASLHVKRDDLSAAPYGGGKTRKLELLLGGTLANRSQQVITFGGMGSHHAAATAIYGRQLGLQVHLFLLPQPRTDEVCRVVQTCHAQGAKLYLAGRLPAARRQAKRLAATNPADFVILAAGGSAPLGNLGFVNAAFELSEQVAAGKLPKPDEVTIALGTMGSTIGLSIGLSAAGLDTTIVAVRASSRQAASWHKLAAQHRDTVAWLRRLDPSFPDVKLDPSRLRIEDRYLGEGYAVPTPRGKAATRVASKHGLRLDDTYTAKAFAALLATAGAKARGKHLLFWHTHSARPLAPTGVDLEAIPAPFRGYAACPQ